jgi:hypothetical protein
MNNSFRWTLLVGLGFLLAGMGAASAQQPTFPLLQEDEAKGGARLAFIAGTYETCLKTQRGFAENASLSSPELGAFCLCYGRALASAISGADYEAFMAGQTTESFLKKTPIASDLCIARMTPSAQPSQRKQEVVTLTNKCLREYHPEDTDIAAAIVRDTFCGCFSDAVARSEAGIGEPRTKPKSRSEAIDYCSQRLVHDAPPLRKQ